MTKEDFLKKAAEKWEELKELKDTSANFHSYEKDFDELWINLGRETLEGSIGVPGSDRRKKKDIDKIWKDRNL